MQNAPGRLGHSKFLTEDMIEIELDGTINCRPLQFVRLAGFYPAPLIARTIRMEQHQRRLHPNQ